MAENTENQEVNELPDTPVDESTAAAPAQEREYSDVEKQAMAQGWVPEDQYQGTGKWRSAEDFLDRGELFGKIDELKRRNQSMETTIHEVKRHYKKVAESEYRRAINQLRSAKKVALDDGDSARVIQIDDAIAAKSVEARQELARLDQPVALPPAADPVYMVWENRNPWYSNNKAMKIYADTLGEELVLKGMTNPTEVLNEIERRVKREFPQQFTNPARRAPGAVEGGGSKGSGSKDSFQLSAEETQVMNKFVKHGVMTKDEYIKEIKATRGVK